MKTFNKLMLATALAAGLAPAMAADQSVDLSTGHASFIGSDPVLDGGDDMISFDNLAAGTYDFLLSVSAQNISDLNATLNGQDATILSYGKFSFAALESTGTAPFVLKLTGITNADSLYSGEFTVSAVPEPETYALLLAGLGMVGFIARRRNRV